MNDDLVTRLRDWSMRLYPMKYGACMEEAADEIERLRKLIAHIQSQTWEMCDANDPCEMCKVK
jgi:hypothetical protein